MSISTNAKLRNAFEGYEVEARRMAEAMSKMYGSDVMDKFEANLQHAMDIAANVMEAFTDQFSVSEEHPMVSWDDFMAAACAAEMLGVKLTEMSLNMAAQISATLPTVMTAPAQGNA